MSGTLMRNPGAFRCSPEIVIEDSDDELTPPPGRQHPVVNGKPGRSTTKAKGHRGVIFDDSDNEDEFDTPKRRRR